MKKFIGCDLGGTNLRAAIVDVENGEVLGQESVPTMAREGHDAVMDRMAGLFEKLIASTRFAKNDIGGIGIGAPGVLDLDKGETLFLPNLPGAWVHVPLRDRIQHLVDLETCLINDARAITYGEWRFGAGANIDTVAVYTLGTGVGGGLIINGQLHLGIGGTGGELGHVVVDCNGPRCGCGNFGCLEVYASGPAIAANGMKAVAQGSTTHIDELCKHDLNRITPQLVAEAARGGDKIARDIYNKAGFYLGVAASNVCATVGPRRIILAGGVSHAGDLLIIPMWETLKARMHVMPIEQVDIVTASLGDNAGVIGAACWASHMLQQEIMETNL